ncbi:PIR protein [Plasmodium vivax]|uniref:VIR protein n=1 Tax=Plasmodium vivax TaxID=5855 RepID=A0A565A3G5_PLAVI|nr:PIR protein [Plasmodium vivax]
MEDVIDESKQIPNIFNEELNKYQETKILDDLVNYKYVSEWVDKQEIKEILAMLARNIRLIISRYSKNPDKRCRDVNHWINEKIESYRVKNSDNISGYATAVFNDIKWPPLNNERVCVKKEKLYSAENAKLMKKLDDYCEIRDDNGCNKLKDKNHCIKCNKYIQKKKEEFTTDMESTCPKRNCEWGKYTFACRCTLNDMDITFPELYCDTLFKEPEIKKHSLLEIGFFVIVTFLLFYFFTLFLEKFTPVGSIMSRFKRRKYDLKKIIERGDDDRYSLYHSDRMPADSENKRYYIEYARPHN